MSFNSQITVVNVSNLILLIFFYFNWEVKILLLICPLAKFIYKILIYKKSKQNRGQRQKEWVLKHSHNIILQKRINTKINGSKNCGSRENSIKKNNNI